MFTLLTEVHFWTTCSDIQVRPSELGVFRLLSKKEFTNQDVHESMKESWANSRGVCNKGGVRRRLRKLEDTLRGNYLVSVTWPTINHLRLVFASGLICTITVSSVAGSPAITHLSYDKYLVGKLLNGQVHQVIFSRCHVIVSYTNEHQLTIVHLGKAATRLSGFDKLARLEPRLTHVDLSGNRSILPNTPRNMSTNATGDLLLVWWHRNLPQPHPSATCRLLTPHAAQPWSPTPRGDADRANVHLYALTPTTTRGAIDAVAYLRVAHTPVCIAFAEGDAGGDDVMWVVEQVINHGVSTTAENGRVVVDVCCYCIGGGAGGKRGLLRRSATSIPLHSPVSCWAFASDCERIALGCVDGSIAVLDTRRAITRLVKATIQPVKLAWHCDGTLLLVVSDLGQIQVFDSALSLVKTQLISEDLVPSTIIDLSCYFTRRLNVTHLSWCVTRDNAAEYTGQFVPTDSYVAICFNGGPTAVLSFIGAGGLSLDISQPGFTPDVLIRLYLLHQQIDRAISLLLSLNWDVQGAISLASLYHITNAIMRSPGKLTTEKTTWLEIALGSFFAPQALSPPDTPPNSFTWAPATIAEFGEQVHDLARRFFHLLLRNDYGEKAFKLAIDLRDADLFADLSRYAARSGDTQMANAVRLQITELFEVCSSDEEGGLAGPGGSDGCSSCDDTSSTSSDSDKNDVLPPLPSVPIPAKKQPPLPEITRHTHKQQLLMSGLNLSRHGKLRESAFFTRNPANLFNLIIPEEESDLDQTTPTTMILTPEMPTHHHVIEQLYDLPSRSGLPTASINRPRQKVKFSDTVTQIVVPNISRSTSKYEHSFEGLQESPPLTTGSFNLSRPNQNSDDNNQTGTIKVIHFGVV